MTDDGHQVMAKAHVAFGKVSEKWIPGTNFWEKKYQKNQHKY